MRQYELMVILDPELDDRTVQPSLERFLKVVTTDGGSVDNVDIWGRRRLAYEIKKQKRGHYVFFQIKSLPPVISELERTFKLTDAVIKFMTVKLEKELRTRPAPKVKPEGRKEEPAKADKPAA